MTAHRAGQYHPLHVASLSHQVVHRVSVGAGDDVLGDDRSRVEIGRRVVRGRTDQLDASLVGLVVGSRTGEGGSSRLELSHS